MDIHTINMSLAGNHAVKVTFCDGRDTGMYSWLHCWKAYRGV